MIQEVPLVRNVVVGADAANEQLLFVWHIIDAWVNKLRKCFICILKRLRGDFEMYMSAGSHIQMAPQSTVNTSQSIHSQDSNMSTGNVKMRILPYPRKSTKQLRQFV
ncbi:hypothetical protein HUJ05_008417 [Dendroctonus ponderosae]|nr:hypothetical protein HUJ05_008417 [Dendroctonus ponderosae]